MGRSRSGFDVRLMLALRRALGLSLLTRIHRALPADSGRYPEFRKHPGIQHEPRDNNPDDQESVFHFLSLPKTITPCKLSSVPICLPIPESLP